MPMKPADLVKQLLDEVATPPRQSVGIEQVQVSRAKAEAFHEYALDKAGVGDRVAFEPEPGDMDFGTVTKIVGNQLHFDRTNKSDEPGYIDRDDASYIIRWRVGNKVYNSLEQLVEES